MYFEVTPVFEDDNLVASGVLMEAQSVEDGGEGISFYVYVYNVQPGIEIDYETGKSRESEGAGKRTGSGRTVQWSRRMCSHQTQRNSTS